MTSNASSPIGPRAALSLAKSPPVATSTRRTVAQRRRQRISSFFPQILPSDNLLKLKQLKSLRVHNFRFMLSKRLRKRFDMVVSAAAVDEISPEEGGGERVTGLGAGPRGFRK